MIDQTTLATYLAILLGFVFIPGPAVLLTLARASGSGTRVGLATGIGIAVGDLIHTAMLILGLSAAIAASAMLFNLIKYAGAAYLIYLGIRALFERAAPLQLDAPSALSTPTAFRQAILAEVLNPKSAMFFLAFLPQFVRPENGPIASQLAILGVLFIAMGLVSTITVAICAGSVGHILRQNPKLMFWQAKLVGLVFCGLGIRLALQDR